MANIIKPKRTNTAGNTPTTSNLTSGELGVNMADQKTYINNGTAVVQIGAGKLLGLGDVNITSPSNAQALIYDSATSKWVNGAGGGGGGVSPITQNYTTVLSSITIASGSNGFSVGPMTTNTGVNVSVASGQLWVIL